MVLQVSKRILGGISVLAAIYWVVLFGLTHSPITPSWGPEGVDKAEHGIAYFLLAAILASIVLLRGGLAIRSLALVWVLVAAYGVFDELSQQLVPGRSCSLYDWFADVIGATLGILVVSAVYSVLDRWRIAPVQSRE